ncbi:MAG: Gfo/Idh/MocA family oxidoreductase [Bacteroidales bacterium]|jgi:UDP-N-acetyl-2-amino-2-deoxyglucuronate dehydrogenase|nr:Gfo/Idh/MocA family oxidoreductase [Bacteroidales bacterium]
MKNFAIIGVAGYIAQRHVKAVKDTNNNLVAALDKFDSVGFLDSYFPKVDFFTEFERFDRHVANLAETEKKIDYVSICTPNYLHDSHIRFALRNNANAICEKPSVLNPWNVDKLIEFEKNHEKKIFNILQLRLHPAISALKQKINNSKNNKKYNIDLAYITSRGNWYHYSWKGDIQKSGGIATNIGIHFFDMLIWIFGNVISSKIFISDNETAGGLLELENANIKWMMSINEKYLPKHIKEQGKRTYRSLIIENEEIEFSDGFTELHTESYKKILAGQGFRIEETRNCIQTAYDIRNAVPIGLVGDYHELLKVK